MPPKKDEPPIEAIKVVRLCNVHAETIAPGKILTVGVNKDLTPAEATEMIAIGRAVPAEKK